MQAILKITTSSTSFEDLANEELLPIVSSKRKKEKKKIIVFYLNIDLFIIRAMLHFHFRLFIYFFFTARDLIYNT